MKNTAKLVVISIFALVSLSVFLSGNGFYGTDAAGFSEAMARPTPPKNKNTNSVAANSNTKPTSANSNVNSTVNTNAAVKTPMTVTPVTTPSNTAANTSTVPPTSGGKSIPKTFTLGADSQSEYGEATFDHDLHAFKNYSPDGKSVMGCVECHHTDAPKSALKTPYVTSERNEVLTFETWQRSSQPVTKCRDCHFQDGNVPDGKTMPKANGKELNNQLAYHINCNSCHDAAFKLRPELKTHKGFATSKDCAVCHKVS